MAEIAQLQSITDSMKSSYGGIIGRTSPKIITPGKMSFGANSISEQTPILDDIRELQQQQLKQSLLTNSFLAKSFKLELDKVRRDKDQGDELKKELAKMTGAGAAAGTLGMNVAGKGGEGGGLGLADLAGTALAVGGASSVAKTLVGGKGKGTDKTGKKTGKLSKGKNFVKGLARNKFVKGGGLLTALLSVAGIAAEFSDIDAAKASGDEQKIYDEKRDVAEVAGSGAGALGGMASGALAGAAIGSVVPVIGTAIGGFVGGILGSMGGAYLGEKAGGGLFDLFADDPKEKEAKKAYEESVASRVSIKKSELKGRGFNHRGVNTYWFGKGKDGKWYVYATQRSKKALGVVSDNDVIDFLEGRINKIPNGEKEEKDFQSAVKSNVPETDVLEQSTATYDMTGKDGLRLTSGLTASLTNLATDKKDYTDQAKSDFDNYVAGKSTGEKAITRRNIEGAKTKEEFEKLLKPGEYLRKGDVFDGESAYVAVSGKDIVSSGDEQEEEVYKAAYDIARNRIDNYLKISEKNGFYDSKNKKFKYDFEEDNFREFINQMKSDLSRKLVNVSRDDRETYNRLDAVANKAVRIALSDATGKSKRPSNVEKSLQDSELMSPDDLLNQDIDADNKNKESMMSKVKNFFGFGKKDKKESSSKSSIKNNIDRQLAEQYRMATGNEADPEQIAKMKANLSEDGGLKGGFAQGRFLTESEYSAYKGMIGSGDDAMMNSMKPEVRNYLKKVSPMSSDKIQPNDTPKRELEDFDGPTGNVTVVNNSPVNSNTTSSNTTNNTAALDTVQDPYKDRRHLDL